NFGRGRKMALSLLEFADKINEIMPVIMRESARQQRGAFYKIKVTVPQLAILGFLKNHGEAAMTHMARYMSVTTAAVTGIVERLVREGYAVRRSDPKDRRVVKVKLTPKGASLIGKMEEQRRKAIMGMFSKVSQRDREEYLRILKHIQDSFKRP
ncbi:MAG: MarR family transcriptional regulator, partial [Candidatus Omnitrophica bacterium]|nr:MarR family transcriptional regulator [Candidatus Omnitrophota bacterium]